MDFYKESISIKEVSKITGKSPQFIRVCIQQNIMPGIAIKMPGNKRFSYLVTLKNVEDFFGIKIERDKIKKVLITPASN